MLRLGMSPKTAGNSVKKNKTLVTALFILAFFCFSGYSVANMPQEQEKEGQIALHDKVAERYIHKARKLAEQRGEVFSGYRLPLERTSSVEYAKYRASVWKERADRQALLTASWWREMKTILSRCREYGAPRRICEALLQAAKQERLPKSWAYSHATLSIVKHESGFRPCVRNGGVIDCAYRGDRAWGLFQFLGSTWSITGLRRTADPTIQARAGFRYIKRIYGTPEQAWNHWLRNRSY